MIKKCIEKNGIRLWCKVEVEEFFRHTHEKKIIVKNNIKINIYDIDVQDAVETIDFSSTIIEHMNEIVKETTDKDDIRIYVELKNSKKQFYGVKKIVFSNDFEDISLSNFNFPNVRTVKIREISEKKPKFISGKFLATTKGKLLNTFCLSENESLNLKNITSVADDAFNGCTAVKIKGLDKINLTTSTLHGYIETEKSPFIVKLDKNNIIKLNHYTKYIANDIINEHIKECTIILTNNNHFSVLSNFLISCNMDDYDCKLRIQIDISKKISCDDIFSIFDINSKNISDITLSKNNQIYKICNNLLYSKDGKILYRCLRSKSGMVTIPDGVQSVFDSAFYLCRNIDEVILPDSVSYIGSLAFSYMDTLKRIHIGKGIERLDGTQIFFKDKSLIEVEIPENVKYIGEGAFKFCENLNKVVFHEGLEVISKTAFQNCSKLNTISLPSTLKFIGDDVFAFSGVRVLYFNSEHYFPKGIIRALIYFSWDKNVYNSIDGITLIDIKTGMHLYLPLYSVKSMSIYMLSQLWDSGALKNRENEFVLKYFKESCFVLMSLYNENPNNKQVKHLLKAKEKIFIDIFLKNAKSFNEECCIKILNADFLSFEALKKLLNEVEDNSTISAYILDTMRKHFPNNNTHLMI